MRWNAPRHLDGALPRNDGRMAKRATVTAQALTPPSLPAGPGHAPSKERDGVRP